MICYFCDKERGAGGTTLATTTAVAICTLCGAGVCAQHATVTNNGTAIRCVQHAHVVHEPASAFAHA